MTGTIPLFPSILGLHVILTRPGLVSVLIERVRIVTVGVLGLSVFFESFFR